MSKNKNLATLKFLGTGGSMGIPVVGCLCRVCHSDNPLNKRLRASALIQMFNKSFLIDAGPDFREQALKYRIDHLDGVIFTHAHHDHTGGIDELRAFYLWTRSSLPCLMSEETALEVKDRYKYIFSDKKSLKKLVSKFALTLIEKERGDISFVGHTFRYFTFVQAGMKVNGFRMGNLGFVSDIKIYPQSIFKDLEGVEVLVLSALRFERSPLHFSIEEALEFAQKVGAQKTYLTHLSHEVDHEQATKCLPSNVSLAYDGLVIPFNA